MSGRESMLLGINLTRSEFAVRVSSVIYPKLKFHDVCIGLLVVSSIGRPFYDFLFFPLCLSVAIMQVGGGGDASRGAPAKACHV